MNIMKMCKSDIEKICAYCEHSSSQLNQEMIICRKKGAVLKTATCRKFRYDPLKRKPPQKPRLKKPVGELSF